MTKTVLPSKTYAFDIDSGEVGGFIDGAEAIRQFIRKTVATARFRFLIYNSEYGSEIEDLIGQDIPLDLLQAEIPRVLKEALIYDDRITDVSNFVLSREDDKLTVTFDVTTREGVITEGVTL
ncbi:DUF2634 domain-containing protein [Paenibacillus sp. SI8]|uniref:DUF2634 domain-containing protein n=1 Tax=unclassified Paenibacillus TaxID=185978 RepID=UPI0034678DD3